MTRILKCGNKLAEREMRRRQGGVGVLVISLEEIKKKNVRSSETNSTITAKDHAAQKTEHGTRYVSQIQVRQKFFP